jgi:transposase-like protein
MAMAAKWARTRGTVKWSPRVAARIVARVAQGETLYAVLREPGMPTPQSVGRWALENRDFGEELAAARVAGGRPARGGGGVWTYCEETARAVYDRLCEGESLTSICRDPTMPSMSTVFYWRRAFPDFDATVRTARTIQAERFCEMGWELASEAQPETAYLTHVRLTHLRWMAGAMAPKAYRPKLMEPEAPRERETILYRHFEIEVNKETGKREVIAWCPNPETGEAEREDTPGWRPPPGVRLPGGR